MKFKSFKVVPCIRVRYPEEGVGYYELADDQDPLLLARAEQAEPLNDCVLPADLELRWAYSGVAVAVREVSSNPDEETPIYGDFCGFGSVIEATYVNDEGVRDVVTLSEGGSQYIEQLCAALNALLEPVHIVADVSNGILNGTWSDRPARVLYISDDPDDVLDFDDYCLVPADENMNRPNAWWLHDAELDGGIIDHFHNQMKEG